MTTVVDIYCQKCFSLADNVELQLLLSNSKTVLYHAVGCKQNSCCDCAAAGKKLLALVLWHHCLSTC